MTSYQRFAKVMRLSLKKRQAQNLENQRSNNTQTLKILLIKIFRSIQMMASKEEIKRYAKVYLVNNGQEQSLASFCFQER
ncbi:MAG: hypothetical protein SPL94_00180, partial [Oribacterium sp.]|nr:hypothetical protein [Oribacterium sp.]